MRVASGPKQVKKFEGLARTREFLMHGVGCILGDDGRLASKTTFQAAGRRGVYVSTEKVRCFWLSPTIIKDNVEFSARSLTVCCEIVIFVFCCCS